MEKIIVKAILIAIRKSEGDTAVDNCALVFSWAESDQKMKEWARRIPASAFGDHCIFQIIFADGKTYQGEYYLKQSDIFRRNLLAEQIIEACEKTRSNKEEWLSFIEAYDIPGSERVEMAKQERGGKSS